jgi:hypothetical protein
MRVNSKCGFVARIAKNRSTGKRLVLAAILMLLCCDGNALWSQSEAGPAAAPETLEQRVDRLTAAIAKAQNQMDAYQQQLLELRQQLGVLQLQMAAEKTASSSGTQPATAEAGNSKPPAGSTTSLDEVKERQAMEESQISTLDTTKVETESKYPLKVSGLLLFNGFVNTRQVDISASPAYALAGAGSTGLSLRQTVLGLDARGPHLFNATSHADVRVDFWANDTASNYAASGLLRLRTAHAALDWPNTEAFVELDRSILEPNEPSSLVAIAQPELAWAGNLWTWNPQVGISHQFTFSDSGRIQAEVALIDTSDPQLPLLPPNTSPVTQTEGSRWPGTEARVAFLHGEKNIGPEIGVGGYFSPHRTEDGDDFDAWAGTVDLRFPMTTHFEMTANAYRGQALAGLGAGGYVNFFYRYVGLNEIPRALDDVGGWAQLKARMGQRAEINTGFGTDNPFAKEIQDALSFPQTAYYPGLARNRSIYSNVIYSPSAYLLFSLEYKRLWTNYGSGSAYFSDSIGIGAGYRF